MKIGDSIPHFSPNLGPNDSVLKGFALLPEEPGTSSVDDYVRLFSKAAAFNPASARNITDALVKSLDIQPPPKMMTYARISYLPEQDAQGVINVPGIPPSSMQKVVRENLAPQMIIGMRVDDVQRYASPSTHPWKPGWKIELRDFRRHPTTEDKKLIQEARSFIQNCNSETSNARERDAADLTNFKKYLALWTRDSLTFDGGATWTDMDGKGRVKAFRSISAAQIRLTGPGGYNGDKDNFAVLVDEMNSVIRTFNRDELIWYVRNPRNDIDVFNYGYSECEISIKLIQGFQNALEFNHDIFTKDAVPKGILKLIGNWTERQVDIMQRVWRNMKEGISKAHGFPVVGVPKDTDIEILDMSNMKAGEAYYQDYINMMIGAFCTVYRFPVKRLGYRISGNKQPTQQDDPTVKELIDEEDPGLPPLLTHIETMLNEYVVWSRYPDLQFAFTAKTPKEDARDFESRTLAMTVGERRAASDLDSYASMDEVKDGDEGDKLFAKLMDIMPADPALLGGFQSVIQAAYGISKGSASGAGEPGARMGRKIDPAEAEMHGHPSGVRRDSAAEEPKPKS